MKKRFLCIMLIICTASRLLPAGASAAEAEGLYAGARTGLFPA